MANILRYHPADDAFDDLVRGYFMRPLRFDAAQPAQIKIDVSEDDKAYSVAAEIPGVKKEDIKVSIESNQVAISAEIKNEKTVGEGHKQLRSERYYGQVSRAFSLAQDVDEAGAEAKYQDGVLQLKLPKRAAARSKHLEIK
ncbi:MAG: heat shock protein Hsp20 [Proteobacteria bacterium]|nr:heat shock protein Hsp20 [Pseudomonadota bacterium]